MDVRYLVKREKIPYPCIILKRNEVTESELIQMSSIIMAQDSREDGVKSLAELEDIPTDPERVHVLIPIDEGILSIGSVSPEQVVIFTNIFHEDIEGYLEEGIDLHGADEVSAVLGGSL